LPKPVTDDALRAALLQAAAPARASITVPAALDGAPAAGARVLLVEDNPVNAEIAIEMLESLGAEVVHARDGKQAVQASAERAFDAVLMDCQMPVLDGYGATRAIRAREKAEAGAGAALRRLPIIALTANALGGDRERCLAAGMDDHLAKPYSQRALASMLARWLPFGADAADAADPAPAAAPMVDREALTRSLQAGGQVRPALAVRVIGLFIEHAPALIERLHRHVEAGERAEAERAFHALRSSCTSVGALPLAQLAHEAELAARAGPAPALRRQTEAVERAVEPTLRELEALREEFAAA
ncbi:MAG: response regulator, partial [Burkholderiales bacterium]|nr:response regulator [Burkholderiales bacterium]